jgi:F420-non-reducing hydrogenase small subunit
MTEEKKKLKLAVYWAAACGGCDVAITQLNEKVLDLAAAADIVFWPCAMDFKTKDVEDMPDGSIDLCLFNGAVRTSQHEHMAKLLRRKSKVMVAYGACACFGGVPALANVSTAAESIHRAFIDSPSTNNPKGTLPSLSTFVPEGELDLPVIWDTVHSLRQVVPVEYFVPGCPPPRAINETLLSALVNNALPPVGATIAGDKAVCTECLLEKKHEMRVSDVRRIYQFKPEPGRCLMEQGLVCMGSATRSGCGAACTKTLMPCIGCFGPLEGVQDQGAAMLSAFASAIDSNDEQTIARIIDRVPDPLGTFNRFSMSESMLQRTIVHKEPGEK